VIVREETAHGGRESDVWNYALKATLYIVRTVELIGEKWAFSSLPALSVAF
jgi:hypothetical protein